MSTLSVETAAEDAVLLQPLARTAMQSESDIAILFLTACVLLASAILWRQLRIKLSLCLYAVLFFNLSRDSNFQLPPDPGKSSGEVVKTKRIVFIRHGESVWNECFNRPFDMTFKITFLFRLLWNILKEIAMLADPASVFIDSPLSQEGLEQSKKLQEFVDGPEGAELRRLCENGAVFTCSCLRRAAATFLIAFAQVKGDRPVWVHSALQEISRNIDALALARPYESPFMRDVDTPTVNSEGLLATFNKGNKGLMCHAGHRLEEFCEWALSDVSPAALQPTVVAAGHSIWFQTFFQAYMPHAAYHECKHRKLVNCGVLAFDLELLQGLPGDPPEYRVKPESVQVIYGGFVAANTKSKRGSHDNKKSE